MSDTLDPLERLLAERCDLGATGTPLHPLPRLREALGPGAPRIYVKRDDLMPLGGGGNKLRKLELLLADARRAGAVAVGSIGGPTSNHVRLVCAAAASLGLRGFAYITGDASARRGGNLRLLPLVGATVVEVPALGAVMKMGEWARADFEARSAEAGVPGAWIPFGGATPRGDLGYVVAARELLLQARALGIRPRALHVAVGTGGTFAGLAAGAAAFFTEWPEAETVGWAVTPKGAQVFSGLPSVPAQIARTLDELRALGLQPAPPRYRFEHGQVGPGYARPTDAAAEAIALLASREGLFVDPVYTGKALAGLIADVRAGRYRTDDEIVFIHTGGFPGLFFDAGT